MKTVFEIILFGLAGAIAGVAVMTITGGDTTPEREPEHTPQEAATGTEQAGATTSSGEEIPPVATTTADSNNATSGTAVPASESEQPTATTSQEPYGEQPALDPSEMRDIIEGGVEWLKRVQEESGRFRYEYNALSGKYSDEDLMARQAGAAFVLAKTLRHGEDPFSVGNTLERSFGYFQSQSRNGEHNGYKFRCILRKAGVCSLGATSLVLVSMTDFMEEYPDRAPKYRQIARLYRNFLLAMQKEEGGFRGFYHFDREHQPANESHFSNGEAQLALVHYRNRRPGDDEVERAMDKAFSYFNERYREEWNWNFYLWGMAAIQHIPEEKRTETHYRFARDFTDWRIAGFQDNRGSWFNSCAYVEGVISAYDILKERLPPGENRRYTEEIRYWLNRSRQLQVTEEGVPMWAGGTINRIRPVKPERATGGFVTALDEPKLRIDFTQHCVSSYMQWLTYEHDASVKN